jgi:hypothetical protein
MSLEEMLAPFGNLLMASDTDWMAQKHQPATVDVVCQEAKSKLSARADCCRSVAYLR